MDDTEFELLLRSLPRNTWTPDPATTREGIEKRRIELNERANAILQKYREGPDTAREAPDNATTHNARSKEVVRNFRSERRVQTSQTETLSPPPLPVPSDNPRATPSFAGMSHKMTLQSLRNTLSPIKLHEQLPDFVFATDTNLIDGSELPSSLMKTFCTTLKEMLQLLPSKDNLNKLSGGTVVKDSDKTCVFLWLKGTGNSLWTFESRGKYACKTCANLHRLCMSPISGTLVLLPLPKAVRKLDGDDVAPEDVGYWLTERENVSRDATIKAQNIWPA